MKHNPGFLQLVEEAKRRIQECTVAEVKARLDLGERFKRSLVCTSSSLRSLRPC